MRGGLVASAVALAWRAPARQDDQDVDLHRLLCGQYQRRGRSHRAVVRFLSIAPERLTGERASVERQSIAATAFTALVDALWLGLFALRPGNNIPTASLVLGLIGLTSTTGLTLRLWRARHRERLSNRWPFLLLVIIGLYGYQTSTAFTAGGSEAAQSDAATLVFVFFGVGLARAWELLGLRGGGLLDLLATGGRRAGLDDGTGHEPDGPGSGPAAGAGR